MSSHRPIGVASLRIPQEILRAILEYAVVAWSDCEAARCFWFDYNHFASQTPMVDEYANEKFREASRDLFGVQGVSLHSRFLVRQLMLQAMKSWSCKKFRSRFILAASEGCLFDMQLSYESTRGLSLKQNLGSPYHRPLDMDALCFASEKSHASVVEFLISKGVDVQGHYPQKDWPPPLPYLAWTPQSSWYTPLCASAEFSRGTTVMRILLKNGAKVNAPSPFHGRTPLQCAIHSSDHPASAYKDTCAKVRILLEHGADPAIKGRDGEFPECLALHSAASRTYPEVVELLLDHGALVDERDVDFTPLMRSSMARCPRTTRMLLQHGADPNAQLLESGYAPLALALIGEHGVPQKFSGKEISTIEVLIEHGAEVNGRNRSAPLFLAIERQDGLLVDFLISKGADVCKPDDDGYTPIERCIEAGKYAMMPHLIAQGADPSGLSSHHQVLLDYIFPAGVCIPGQRQYQEMLCSSRGDAESTNMSLL